MERLVHALRVFGRVLLGAFALWLILDWLRSLWFAARAWGIAGLVDSVVLFRLGLALVIAMVAYWVFTSRRRSLSPTGIRNAMLVGAGVMLVGFAGLGGRVAWSNAALATVLVAVAMAAVVARPGRIGGVLLVAGLVASVLLWSIVAVVGFFVHGYGLVPFPGPIPAVPSDPGEARATEARFLLGELSRLHPAPYDTVSESDYWGWARAIEDQAPTMTPAQLNVELMRFTASLADEHTSVSADWAMLGKLAVEFRWFGDELFVVGAGPAYLEANGKRVMAIGGVPVAEAHERLAEYRPHRNQSWARYQTAQLASMFEVLVAAGLAEPGGGLVLDVVDEESNPVTVTITGQGSVIGAYADGRVLGPGPDDPSGWWEPVGDDGLYFRYLSASDPLGFRQVAAQFWAEVDRREPARLIVDLRGNGGGNSYQFEWLWMSGLADRSQYDDPSRLYVLIDSGTFSAAADNAAKLADQTQATLLGEPTGGGRDGWGEVRSLRYDRSAIRLSYSTKYFGNRDDPQTSIDPDHIVITPGFAALRGEDWVLAAALDAPG